MLWTIGAVSTLQAQTPRVAPRAGVTFHDQQTVGTFQVQRWVDAANPEVSPSGNCDCVTVVYSGNRKVLTIDPGSGITTTIDPRSGQDINGDNIPELIVSQYTGGAHCCSSTTIHSLSTELKTILDVQTGNCPGEFEDVDHDGKLEFVTCDDAWAYEKCAFAFSPMPVAVFTYSAAAGKYAPDTPHYREHFQKDIAESIAQAEKQVADAARDPDQDACTVLGPVLDLMYVGRFDEGVALFRRLYRRGDATELERQAVEKVRSSPFWVPITGQKASPR